MDLEKLEILEYSEKMGRVCWPADFAHELEGKTIRQQLEHYRVFDRGVRQLSYYLLNWAKCSGLQRLEEYGGWEKLIVRDGKVVGFVRNGRTILPYGVVEDDYDCDNNGAGYKERTSYFYLVCVPEKLDRERVFAPPFGATVPELKLPMIPYDGSRGADPLPEGFARRLEGKPLSAQMYYFSVHSCNPESKPGWVDDWEKYGGYYLDDLCRHRDRFLPFQDEIEALIVQDGKIVGVRIRLGDHPEAGTADLYPYETQVCPYRMRYSRSESPRRRQLICLPLPG